MRFLGRIASAFTAAISVCQSSGFDHLTQWSVRCLVNSQHILIDKYGSTLSKVPINASDTPIALENSRRTMGGEGLMSAPDALATPENPNGATEDIAIELGSTIRSGRGLFENAPLPYYCGNGCGISTSGSSRLTQAILCSKDYPSDRHQGIQPVRQDQSGRQSRLCFVTSYGGYGYSTPEPPQQGSSFRQAPGHSANSTEPICAAIRPHSVANYGGGGYSTPEPLQQGSSFGPTSGHSANSTEPICAAIRPHSVASYGQTVPEPLQRESENFSPVRALAKALDRIGPLFGVFPGVAGVRSLQFEDVVVDRADLLRVAQYGGSIRVMIGGSSQITLNVSIQGDKVVCVVLPTTTDSPPAHSITWPVTQPLTALRTQLGTESATQEPERTASEPGTFSLPASRASATFPATKTTPPPTPTLITADTRASLAHTPTPVIHLTSEPTPDRNQLAIEVGVPILTTFGGGFLAIIVAIIKHCKKDSSSSSSVSGHSADSPSSARPEGALDSPLLADRPLREEQRSASQGIVIAELP
jgi:hypothetical protein